MALNNKSEKLTPEGFIDLVRKTPDSQLEKELCIVTSNMEILLGEGNPEENKQKVLDFFKNSPKWQDNNEYWIKQNKEAKTDEDIEVTSVMVKHEHFKYKEGCIGVFIHVIPATRKLFGKEGDFTTDISFYDLENSPRNQSERKKRVIADTFCELMKFSEKNKMPYVVKHSGSVYTGERGYLVAWKPEQDSA